MDFSITPSVQKKEEKHIKLDVRLFAFKLVREFLKDHRYNNTLEIFEEEASDALEDLDDSIRPFPNKTLYAVLEEYEEFTTVDRLSKLSVEKNLDEDLKFECNGKFPQNSLKTIQDVHYSNIISLHSKQLPEKLFNGSDENSTKSYILSGAIDKSVRATELETGKVVSIYEHHKGAILSIDTHPKYNHIMLTSGMDGQISIINLETNKCIQQFKNHKKFVTKALFSPDGQHIVSTSYDHTVNIYKCIEESKDEVQDYIIPKYELVNTKTYNGACESLCITISPEDNAIYTAVVGVREDNYLHYIDLIEGYPELNINMNINGDNWVSFTPMYLTPSPNHKYILCCTDNKSGRTILFRNRSNAQPRIFYGAEIDEFTNPRCCFHSNGQYVFITSNDFSVCVFEIPTAKLVKKLYGHKAIVRDISFIEPSEEYENGLLISCSYDKTIRVWN